MEREFENFSKSSITSARVVQVVKIEHVVGTGKEGDPVKVAIDYWSFDGEFLVRKDLDPFASCDSSNSSKVVNSIEIQ